MVLVEWLESCDDDTYASTASPMAPIAVDIFPVAVPYDARSGSAVLFSLSSKRNSCNGAGRVDAAGGSLCPSSADRAAVNVLRPETITEKTCARASACCLSTIWITQILSPNSYRLNPQGRSCFRRSTHFTDQGLAWVGGGFREMREL